MTTVQLSELGALAEKVKNGETIEILDGEHVVAKVVPERKLSLEEHMDQLVAQGLARRGTGKLPPDFLTRPLPEAEASVLEQLLEDRRTGR